MVPTPHTVRTTLGGDMRRTAGMVGMVGMVGTSVFTLARPGRWIDGQRRLIGPRSAVSAASFPTRTSAPKRSALTTAPS